MFVEIRPKGRDERYWRDLGQLASSPDKVLLDVAEELRRRGLDDLSHVVEVATWNLRGPPIKR